MHYDGHWTQFYWFEFDYMFHGKHSFQYVEGRCQIQHLYFCICMSDFYLPNYINKKIKIHLCRPYMLIQGHQGHLFKPNSLIT